MASAALAEVAEALDRVSVERLLCHGDLRQALSRFGDEPSAETYRAAAEALDRYRRAVNAETRAANQLFEPLNALRRKVSPETKP